MPFRRLLLRVMLWSLALAAVGGVLAVLFSGRSTIWEIVGTMAVTAVTSALMIWMSVLSEREKTREAGLLGMALLAVEWVGAEILIWNLHQRFALGYAFEEQIGLSMLFGAATGALAMIALGLWRRKGFELAGRVGMLLAIVVTALWILGLWWPRGTGWLMSEHTMGGKFAESAWAVAVMGMLIAALLVRAVPLRWWILIGLACSGVTLAMWLTAIWMEIHQSNGSAECIAIVAAVTAISNLLRLVRLQDTQQWVVRGTIAATTLTGALIAALILLGKQNADTDLLGRLAAASALTTGCGALALIVLSRLNRQDTFPQEIPSVTQMHLTCPICQMKQTAPIGESRCGGCGLILDIRVKEPRCRQCNYLLLMLNSDRCPECGAVI